MTTAILPALIATTIGLKYSCQRVDMSRDMPTMEQIITAYILYLQ